MSMSMPEDVLRGHVNPVFIETGTFDGRGAAMAKRLGFKTVHTIELDPARVVNSRKNLSMLEGVTVHEGDTVEILPLLLAKVKERATIFLDAHPVGEGDPCKIGKYRHPLLHELELLATTTGRRDHTIIVDDRHEFPLYPTTDDEVANLLMAINPRYRVQIVADMVIAEWKESVL